jgi:hypothetical protein
MGRQRSDGARAEASVVASGSVAGSVSFSAAPAGTLPPGHPADAALLAAVREDIRQTLRVPWVDPGIEAAARSPVFFTAAWSAIRPNVGKSFLLLARALRAQAVGSLRAGVDFPDLLTKLEPSLEEEQLRRIEHAVAAAHLAAAKAQIVVHALTRTVHRERVPGTGSEESPVRRGIPEWHSWISLERRVHDPSRLQDAERALRVPLAPPPLRLLGQWPGALERCWAALRPVARSDLWRMARAKLRGMVLSGISTLPHPMELQWTALRGRGFTEEARTALARDLVDHEAAAPINTLVAAFVWCAFGGPDIGAEG